MNLDDVQAVLDEHARVNGIVWRVVPSSDGTRAYDVVTVGDEVRCSCPSQAWPCKHIGAPGRVITGEGRHG